MAGCLASSHLQRANNDFVQECCIVWGGDATPGTTWDNVGQQCDFI